MKKNLFSNGATPAEYQDPKAYPGKPGPKPSGGVKRKILFPFKVNDDEFEYLFRSAFAIYRKTNCAAKFVRAQMFTNGWQGRLVQMRKAQGANLKP